MISGSSKKWLERQRRDPFVKRRKAEGYRSRAVYKLESIATRYRLIRAGAAIVDLGAAPGSWSQWAKRASGASGRIVAVDEAPMQAIEGVIFIQADIYQEGLAAQIRTDLGGAADLVLSDLAPPSTGHRATDQACAEDIALHAAALACQLLRPRGHFLVKSRHGGTDQLKQMLQQNFDSVAFVKPPASRAPSAEIYLLARTRLS